MDVFHYRRSEKRFWWRVTPVLVLVGELNIGEMACHAGHGDG